MSVSTKILSFGAAACVGGALALSVPANAWEPTHPIEIIVPAGTGGGADQMSRTMQGIITKHNLSKQPVVVVNKAGGAGGEGFLDVKNAKGNDHKLIITLSNLFTTPLATGIPVNWKDLTPVAMMALDEFVLWVNAEKPYKTVKDYVAAIKAAPDNTQPKPKVMSVAMTVPLKHDSARPKCVGDDAIRTGEDISSMDFLNTVGMCDVPILTAPSRFEAREHELGSHCPIANKTAFAQCIQKEFFHDRIFRVRENAVLALF